MAGRKGVVAVALVAVLAFLSLALPTSAWAEGFADLFLGASITNKGDVDLTLNGTSATAEDQEYKTSFLVGGRAGYWWSFFGINLDLSYFRPEFDPDEQTVLLFDPLLGFFTANVKTDLNVLAIGLNAMLRGQFVKDEKVPDGRLQPYIFAGPNLFVSTFDAEATALGVTVSESDTDASIGLTAGAGLTYMFTKSIGGFAEYRFTYNKPEFNINGLTVEPELSTHHLLAGVTFRF